MASTSVAATVSYDTHSNGGRPYRVFITSTGNTWADVPSYSVRVHSHDGFSEETDSNSNPMDMYSVEPIHTLEAYEVFVGESPLNAMTKFSGGSGERFKGNSILVMLTSGEAHMQHLAPLGGPSGPSGTGATYMYIGDTIFTVRTMCPVIEYVSPVGNNDVPYPYAKDSHGNYYLMIENVVLLHTETLEASIAEHDDPYSYYYAAGKITADCAYTPPQEPILKNFRGIVEYKHGDDRYTMRYTPTPGSKYDRLMSSGEGAMTIRMVDGSVEELTRQSYIDLMTAFGSTMSFERLEVV